MREDRMKELLQPEMSCQHAPDDLVADTLQEMHAEYNRKIQKEAKVRRTATAQRGSAWRRNGFVGGGLAVAMAAVICVSVYRQDSAALRFNEFSYQPDMRMEMIFKSDLEGETSVSTIRDELEKKLSIQLNNYERCDYRFQEFAMSAQAPVMWVAQAEYDGEKDESFRIAVTNFSTVMHDTLGSGPATRINDIDIFTGSDSQTGDLFVVWKNAEEYVQLQLTGEAEWKDSVLIRLIEAAIEMLK